ncbi:MAG: hypothetical protein GF418_05670, partial [Chitinivibrionales bacterium]|nr:hypothetical protein [Chitinivibrionales bacterium]MBD3395099.1 hypothetical protein [Chitinivibrionales bacterium]
SVLDSTTGDVKRTIPASYVSASSGLRAALVVCDGGKCDTVNVSRRVAIDQADDFATPVRRWIPLRVTAELHDTTVDSCLAGLPSSGDWKYDPLQFRMFRWYPYDGNKDTSSKWVEYSKSSADLFSFVPGRVVWLKTAVSRKFHLGEGVSMSLKEPHAIKLKPEEWTDIAVPFRFSIRLADILAATGPEGDSLQFCKWEKTGGDKRDSVSYYVEDIYVPGVPGYDTASDTIAYSALNDAYCVWNPFDTTVVLQVPPNSVDLPPLAPDTGPMAKKRGGAGGWVVDMVSECAGRINTVKLGAAPSGSGVSYYPKRPHFGALDVGVVDPSTRAIHGHAVARAPGQNGVGYEVVFANDHERPREVTVRLTPAGPFPDEYGVQLFNPETGRYEHRGAGYTVGVPARGRAYRFVVAGNEDYRNDFKTSRFAYRFALVGVYPNPFDSRVIVHYSLPYREVAELHFSIFDLRGRRVWSAELGKTMRPGYSRLAWDGRDSRGRVVAAGVYLLRMRARAVGSSKPVMFETRLTRLQ